MCVDAASVKLCFQCSISSASGKIAVWSMSPFKRPYLHRVTYSMTVNVTKDVMPNTALHETLCDRTRAEVKPVNTYPLDVLIIIQYFLTTNTLDIEHSLVQETYFDLKHSNNTHCWPEWGFKHCSFYAERNKQATICNRRRYQDYIW